MTTKIKKGSGLTKSAKEQSDIVWACLKKCLKKKEEHEEKTLRDEKQKLKNLC